MSERCIVEDPTRNSVIVEVGCGGGAQLRFLHGEGIPAIGIDFAVAALERCRNLFEDVPLVAADASLLPLREGVIEGIVDCETFSHSKPDVMPKMWAECARLLRPGGWVVSQGFLEGTDESAVEYVGGATMLTLDGVQSLAESAGLTVVEQEIIERRNRIRIVEGVSVAVKPL